MERQAFVMSTVANKFLVLGSLPYSPPIRQREKGDHIMLTGSISRVTERKSCPASSIAAIA
jgi:hypothetical protein